MMETCYKPTRESAKVLIKRIKDNEDENNILPVVARVGIRPSCRVMTTRVPMTRKKFLTWN